MSYWSRDLPGILLTFSLMFSGWPGSAVASDQPVTVNYLVVDEKTQPFQIVSDGQSRGGIISDIVETVFADSAYAVKHHVMPVNRVRQSVTDFKVQNWVTFDSPVWDSFGDKGERVGVSLFETRHVLMTCSPAVPLKVSSVEDLAGLSIVTLRHFDYLGLTKAAEGGLVRSIPVDRYAAGLELVRHGRVDGFIEMVSRLRYHLTKLEGDYACIREVDVSAIIPNYPIQLYVDSRWPMAFKQFVAEKLDAMDREGELERIFRRYVADDAPWPPPSQ
ncbi:MAG: transporter substrate-binding domain-containing protein [Marinobacter sp.]|uniref:transporter substrate-binding domain-containing protein n=2 Tax=Marinobacter sp. TaxID=50741 RepID=UPI0034A086FA